MKLKAPERSPIDVNIEALYHGQAFIKISAQGQYIMLVAEREEMIGELKRLLRMLEVKTVEQVNRAQALPVELYKPETAWPWLVEHFPWIFDGISVKTEPYAHYLKNVDTAVSTLCEWCKNEFVTGVTAKYCSHACKQAAYRERKAA